MLWGDSLFRFLRHGELLVFVVVVDGLGPLVTVLSFLSALVLVVRLVWLIRLFVSNHLEFSCVCLLNDFVTFIACGGLFLQDWWLHFELFVSPEVIDHLELLPQALIIGFLAVDHLESGRSFVQILAELTKDVLHLVAADMREQFEKFFSFLAT